MQRLLFAAVCLSAAFITTSAAQSDLDALMSRVLERRDENWKKLQQYTLNERETLQISALAVLRVYGFEREYVWFPREGFFIRSPLEADGVTIGEDERRGAEDRWLRQSQKREERRAAKTRQADDDVNKSQAQPASDATLAPSADDIVRQSFEPQFIEFASLLRFKFDEGQYALVGRERMLERDVLEIEYYPKLLFREDRTEQRRERAEKDEDDKFEDQMNKVSLVTLWVDPEVHQILRYDFRNIDMDFLPIPSLVRVDGMRVTLQMSEPFPSVWLPASVSMRFRIRLAAGPLEGRYEVKYSDYRLPTVQVNVR